MNPAARRVASVFLGAVLGALGGAAIAQTHGGAFVPPEPLDPRRWNVVRPGLDESIADQRGRGSGIVGAELVLTPHVFNRADIVSPSAAQPVTTLRMTLAPGSGPVTVKLREAGRMASVQVAPEVWQSADGGVHPYDGSFEMACVAGDARVGDVVAARLGAPRVELSAESSPARIRSLTLLGADGTVIAAESPGETWAARAPTGLGAGLGAIVGAAVGLAGVGGLVALVPAGGVVLAPAGTWLSLLERLLLVGATPWGVAQAALAAALLPLLVAAAAATGRAMPESAARPLGREAWLLWVGVAGVTTVVGARSAAGGDIWLLPLAFLVAVAPLVFARAARIDPLGLMLRDLPAQAALAWLGFGAGLLPAAMWRFGALVAGAGALLRRAPRASADAVFMSFLLLFPAAELAARASWLGEAWDTAEASADVAPFWEGACGGAPATVVYLGGSSTGGAYQFHGDPEAFFPARVHARLCDSGRAIRTVNLGDGGRDSFTFSRATDTLVGWRPSLVVAYLGVNDLLSQEHTQTRAQLEAEAVRRGEAAGALAALGRSSRLLTGLMLLARPGLDPAAPVVAAVPLPDAEENLRRIAQACASVGAHLLLLPEHAEPETARRIAGYAEMERRLAEELAGVSFLDVRPALAEGGESWLVDRNHLSRAGSERLAELLAREVEARLDGWKEATTSSPP